MKHQEIETIRSTPGASILLFITDRCPVACTHCSVSSTVDSPMISDFQLFNELLQGMVMQSGLKVVGISGGEPFSERRGLTQTCDMLTAAGKSVVIYTSGIWASKPTPIAWIRHLLKQCSTVYLSTDSFHQATATASHFMRAARQVADAGAWIVVQTLEVERTALLLTETFGENFKQFAELVEIQPLRNGRGGEIFPLRHSHPAHQMGSCSLAVTPVIRYDGWITSCCNEDVIMSKGPGRFRSRVHDRASLQNVLDRYKADPLMRCISQVGLGALMAHPKLKHMAMQPVLNNCDLCWRVCNEFPSVNEPDPLIHAIAKLGETQ